MTKLYHLGELNEVSNQHIMLISLMFLADHTLQSKAGTLTRAFPASESSLVMNTMITYSSIIHRLEPPCQKVPTHRM